LLAKTQLKWSCASCDKNLDSFKGKLGEYRSWAVFPRKESTPEKLGKVINNSMKIVRQRLSGNS